MEVKDMDQYFSYNILRRGYDYYKKGKVKNIVKTKDGVIATVRGTDEYRVTISFDKKTKEIRAMECTCPYAENDHCKHMAAVLYGIKNDDFPVEQKKEIIKPKEVTDFDQFKKEYRKAYYQLFNNRYYLQEDDLEDYVNLIKTFISSSRKYVKSDDTVAYQIFEFLLDEIDRINVYDQYGQKEELFAYLFKSFKNLFNNEHLFISLLAFIEMIYTIDEDEYYFNCKSDVLDLTCQYIDKKWQAEDALVLLRRLDNDQKIYDFYKDDFKTKIISLNYYFINKEKAISIANNYLNIYKVCDFLLEVVNKKEERIALLEKIISSKDYAHEKYYKMLLELYKNTNKDKYFDLLNSYFNEYKTMESYLMIKAYYFKEDWLKIRKQYLDRAKKSRVYFDICVEEEYYDELILALQNCWINEINRFIDVLKEHKPKELLELYKNKLLKELEWASDRKNYQKVLANFPNLKRIPNGEVELKDIITYIREHYKNRKALQEELDFFEVTYL